MDQIIIKYYVAIISNDSSNIALGISWMIYVCLHTSLEV